MPYNTRRVSLSLPMLGIALPNTSRSAAHRSPPASAAAALPEQPPSKRAKRTHRSSSPSPTRQQRPAASPKSRDGPIRAANNIAENTPPPSPGGQGSYKVDTEGIGDEVVVGVIEQLEKTGNRPHSAKELAAVLTNTLSVVESSANPAAIIASRLTTYVRRRWTALAPCPIAKELIEAHPKRTYFYLTTCPHQPIPSTTELPPTLNRIISPSLSSAADEEEAEDEDERDARTRAALSPSPEIDLSTADLLDDTAPLPTGASFSVHSPLGHDGTHPPTNVNMAHNRRAASPPLERDEREFTQTASSLQQRSRSQTSDGQPSTDVRMTVDAPVEDSIQHGVEESEESVLLRGRDDAAKLFGHPPNGSRVARPLTLDLSSPVIRPQEPSLSHRQGEEDVEMEDARNGGEEKMLEASWQWAELKSPETVELDELDAMFGEY